MKCLKKEEIRAFLDNEFFQKEKKKIEKHLSECPKCQNIKKEIKEEINFVELKMTLLNPKTIPQERPFDLERVKREEKKQLSLKRFVLSPIKVPAGVLHLLGTVILVLFIMFISKSVKSTSMKSLQLADSGRCDLVFFYANKIQAISLNLDLSEFRPNENPRIFILREEEER